MKRLLTIVSIVVVVGVLTLTSSGGFAAALSAGEFTAGQEGEAKEKAWGTPTSQADHHAWKQISETFDIKKKANLAEKYLKDFPEGGYRPYAHEFIAVAARQANDLDKFFLHAETALKELPDEVGLLVPLSVAMTEKQNPEPAIKHGERALELLPNTAAPEGYTEELWEKQRNLLIADCHYSVGTSYLLKAFNSTSPGAEMKKAMDHLNLAVTMNPQDARSHFRLGFAYQMTKNLEGAVTEFARAAAIGDNLGQMAEVYLEKAYQSLHGNTDGLNDFVKEQAKLLKEQAPK
ncbi:MAG: tetratricopeptide repeat protein [Acidobacteriota bacterium]|nr:MAG: tetratricopeptide repeat protein [Acidobacteriota bacterium]